MQNVSLHTGYIHDAQDVLGASCVCSVNREVTEICLCTLSFVKKRKKKTLHTPRHGVKHVGFYLKKKKEKCFKKKKIEKKYENNASIVSDYK